MKPPPAGWPRISASVFYDDPARAIDWLCRAFGFEVRIKVEHEGKIVHSELTYGEGVIMVGPASEKPNHPEMKPRSPKSLGGATTQAVMLYVDDVDSHCARARAAGAQVAPEPALHDYGAEYWADRSYGARDPEGHFWWFTQRVRDPGAH